MSHFHTEVLLIGAGAAGLAAAHHLRNEGLVVTILEARERIGGRIHTLNPTNWPISVETGAEFLHGSADETRVAVDALNLKTEAMPEEHFRPGSTGVEPADLELGWTRIAERLRTIGSDDLTFADFLGRYCGDLSADEKAQATAYVEGFNAADMRAVSAQWIRESDQETGQAEGARKICAGYARVLDYFTGHDDGLDIHLNRPVSSIRWSRGFVEVSTSNNETFSAQAVIVAVPLGVLQIPSTEMGAIHFSPDLPQKRLQWKLLRMGNVVKVHLLFREPFWEEIAGPDFTFLHTAEGPFQAWWSSLPCRSPILTGWSGGPRAAELSRLTDETILKAGLEQLATSFRVDHRKLELKLAAHLVHNWQADQFARGAYAYVPCGGMALPRQSGEPVENTLFFAGEATHRQLMGTVQGAIASGVRAAKEVVSALRT
ncbi:flavin monoamine oxidase family protein [Anatilimnocola floriformis]|uniref:flavin monoamine oxidase family protein n=1 Tax=Anatilimnocola floriformis TaxID=2948575 RepID=UPI0020C2B4AA|nr:NAD(P)/FAD-dependent oxidoreductase [Anatilimnocola floriformis]